MAIKYVFDQSYTAKGVYDPSATKYGWFDEGLGSGGGGSPPVDNDPQYPEFLLTMMFSDNT